MVKVSLVRCESYDADRLSEAVERSIKLIGGPKASKGAKVLIKPNLLRPRHPRFHVTTHPEFVRAIIRTFKGKGCEIIVGDSPGFHDPYTTAKVCGILDVCREEGAEFVGFRSKKTYLHEDALLMKRMELADIIDGVDYIVNAPKMKTHVMMGVTLAVKNTFGFMVGLNKSQMHLKLADREKFASMLVDINNFVKPDLNLMDGVVGMEGNGPGNGTPISSGLIAASHDSLAMDIVLCRIMGVKGILTNKKGLQTRGERFLEDIDEVGDKALKLRFKPAEKQPVTFVSSNYLAKVMREIMTAKPRINSRKCKACGECMRICPAKAIKMKSGAASIVRKDCIRCYCCHEICPHDAVEIRKNAFGKIMEKFHKI